MTRAKLAGPDRFERAYLAQRRTGPYAPVAAQVYQLGIELGEYVSPGVPLLSLVDLGDVYMTFLLPTAKAGKITLGTEARLVLDAAPHYVIPAEIFFVSDPVHAENS